MFFSSVVESSSTISRRIVEGSIRHMQTKKEDGTKATPFGPQDSTQFMFLPVVIRSLFEKTTANTVLVALSLIPYLVAVRTSPPAQPLRSFVLVLVFRNVCSYAQRCS
jgi:hypothetical protein